VAVHQFLRPCVQFLELMNLVHMDELIGAVYPLVETKQIPNVICYQNADRLAKEGMGPQIFYISLKYTTVV